jgi:sugar/nucleoside kinase (ribokinase family)
VGVFVGLTTIDVVHRLDEFPGPDAKATATGQEVVAGGPAAVAAIAFAGLGGSATLVTALGTHPLAALARADLTASGVRIVDLCRDPVELPVSAVRVDARTGQRSVTSPDATVPALAALELPGPAAELLGGADVLLADGHYPRLAVPVARAAAIAGVPVLLDAGRPRPVFADLLPLADFVIAAAAFSAGPSAALPGVACSAPAPAWATSHGAAPIEWRCGERAGTVPVAAVTGGDTLGAGDVLHGAAALAIGAIGTDAARSRWPEVLRYAADVATLRVGRVGARAWLADPRPREWSRRWWS